MTTFKFIKEEGQGDKAKLTGKFEITDLPAVKTQHPDKTRVRIKGDDDLRQRLVMALAGSDFLLERIYNNQLPVILRSKVDSFKGTLEEAIALSETKKESSGITQADLDKAKEEAGKIAARRSQLEGFLAAWELMPDAQSKGNLLAPFNVTSKSAAEKELAELISKLEKIENTEKIEE